MANSQIIKEIHFNRYRKLKNIDMVFSPGVNAISGPNGTCKSSVLHIISNSYQAVTSKSSWLKDGNAALTIKHINSSLNPKIESLTRGDREYNDPAPGLEGSLFSVTYGSGEPLDFRRHNSSKNSGESRFAVKPYYQSGKNQSLPMLPVIYLGLTRLFPYGEYDKDEQIKNIRDSLPEEHQQRLLNNYEDFTLMHINATKSQAMGDIKNRVEFTTASDGVDSNTISAGEDNLFIILMALESLAYYHDSVEESHEAESILLIDEIDASLHPAFQIKLAELFSSYGSKYGIQIIFTTHSLTLLDYLISANESVIYLLDNLDSVIPMDSPDMYRIKLDLNNKISPDIYLNKSLPIFSEDEETRFILESLFDCFEENTLHFSRIRSSLHLVDGDFGSESLSKLFKDPYMQQSTMASICILDGDHGSNLRCNIVKLPGKTSPEEWLLEYARSLVEGNNDFWLDKALSNRGYSKKYFLSTIDKKFKDIDEEISAKNNQGESVRSLRRKKYKKAFNAYRDFFGYALKHWMHNPGNYQELLRFYNELHNMFIKIAEYHSLDKEAWPKNDALISPIS